VTSTYVDYWGNVQKVLVPYCGTVSFAHVDMTGHGWDEVDTVNAVCKAIIATDANVVYTHSMGNLAFVAGLIATLAGKSTYAECVKLKERYPKPQSGPSTQFPKLAANEIAWISIQGPFRMSVAADACHTVCASHNPLWIPVQKLPIACACPNRVMEKSTQSLQTTYVSSTTSIAQMAAAVAKHAFSVMCGIDTDATGGLGDEVALSATKLLVTLAHGSWGADKKTITTKPYAGTDGLVAFTSCRGDIPGNLFELTPDARYYVGTFNHASGTGRDGQQSGEKDKAKMPISNFISSGKQALNSREAAKGGAAATAIIGAATAAANVGGAGKVMKTK